MLHPVVAATLTTDLAGDDNDMVYTAKTPGAGGNDITVAYVDPEAANQSLAVGVAGSAITVDLATDGDELITSTAAQIKTAIEASGAANALVSLANAGGNDGSGKVTAMAAANLTGGADTPAAAELVFATFDGDTLTEATAGERRYVTVADEELTASNRYAIVIRAADGDSDNKVCWRRDGSSPTYAGGSRVFSSNAGSTWSADASSDFIFEEGEQH
jgi:hypothetical protein